MTADCRQDFARRLAGPPESTALGQSPLRPLLPIRSEEQQLDLSHDLPLLLLGK